MFLLITSTNFHQNNVLGVKAHSLVHGFNYLYKRMKFLSSRPNNPLNYFLKQIITIMGQKGMQEKNILKEKIKTFMKIDVRRMLIFLPDICLDSLLILLYTCI